ncbi:hypothetical protein FGG08_002505 [Glutinoglossum americanum]|uniref:Fungal STAND N-terminal Goodbye domain-containing protein n=1 Tax=Glutinoglossum americanum TaxID=1670608 RepID=A0A9P8IBI5_9PEZI|nr:hypothetical protein FGG08_002505 [Glutinoglossum americanum]
MSDQEPQIPTIYKAAIRRFEEITNKKLDDPDLLRIATVGDLIEEIDKRNAEFLKFRETKRTFFNILEGAMKPIELAGKLAVGTASVGFPPSCLVFGAVVCLVNAAKGTTESYDAIQDLMATLKDFTERLSVYAREQISGELSEKLTVVLTTLIEIFALSRRAIKEVRTLKFARNILLRNNDKIREAVSKLAKLTESEDRLVGAETWIESKRIRRTVDGMAMSVKQSNITVQEMGLTVGHVDIGVTELNEKVTNIMLTIDESKAEAKEEKDKERQGSIKKTLRPSVSAQDWYDKISKTRVPGTGDWVRGEGLFKSWVDKVFPVLWISGTPGAGKSYLSSNVITFLRGQHPQGIQHPSHTSVAYFFFKDDNLKTRSFHQALRDVAYQICQNDPVYTKYIIAQCDSPEEVDSIESAWRILFTDFFLRDNGLGSSVYILLDGIDEAYDTEAQTFLGLVKDLIEEAFEVEVPTIHVTSVKNSEDIVHYIRSSIRKSTILKRVPTELQTEIVDKLSRGAQGMFLWVDLMLRELMKKRSPETLRKSLNEAPKGISKMFRHVLEGFSSSLTDEDPSYLNELLAWTTCAQSPLKLGELDTVLKLRSDDGDGMFYLEGMLRKQYASFFSLIREDGLSTADLQNPCGIPVDSDSDQEMEEEGFDDTENATDFHSNPSTTEVTLCHASIGDFFRDEAQGKVSVGDGHPMIGVNFNEAKISVLKTCLELLCDKKLMEKIKGSPSLLPYAAKNWQHHLRAVDPSKASRADCREIAGLLANMFRSESFMEAWAGEIPPIFFCVDNIEMVRRWLDYKDIRDGLPPGDREWIQSTVDTPADTFLPLARYVAQRWLQDQWWIAQICCRMVYFFINLQKGTPLSASASGPDTAQEILHVAEWAQFEKTALWHRRLAIVFREYAMYDNALIHFDKALQMDDTMWLARSGIAMLHMSKAEYEEAVRLHKVSEETLQKMLVAEPQRSASIKSSLHSIQESVSECYYRLRDKETALEYRQKAFSNNNRCNDCINVCLNLLAEKERYQDIISMLKGMDDEIPGQGYSRLTESFWKNQFELAPFTMAATRASQETNELPFLIDAYHAAIAAAKKELRMVTASLLELCLAGVYYVHGEDQERAVRMWKKIRKTFAASKVEAEMIFVKDEALTCLARHWFKMALGADKGSSLARRCVDKLERLAKFKVQTAGPPSTFISTNTSSIILGLWYRLNDQTEDARACFRAHVKEAIQILSDGDPGNDFDGYLKLGLVFIAAGDDKNAVAMFQALGGWDKIQPEQQEPNDTNKNKEEEASDPVDDDSNEGDIRGHCGCDGPCHRMFPNFHNMALCRYCYDVGFCEMCLKRLKEDDMPLKVCSPKHDWLVIPPPEKEIEAGKLLVDGELVNFDNWKESLKQQWQV